MKKISIIGLGWLGLPLANALVSDGLQVVGSKITPDGIDAARNSGIECYYLNLTPAVECASDDLAQLMQDTDILLIMLPPSKIGASNYIEAIQQLVDSALSYHVPRIMFISSTSVYGSINGLINEDAPLSPETESARALVEVERWLHQLPNVSIDILRLAGLVGNKRHAGRFLAGKKALTGGAQPINLVHQDDVIDAIRLLIKRPNGGHIYNLCAPEHPDKATFYQQAARNLQLVPPEFIATDNSHGKVIDGSRICKQLGFEYQYPDPAKMPMSI